MASEPDLSDPDRRLRRSFERSLQAARKAAKTQTTYLDSLDQFVAFLVATGRPTDVAELTRDEIEDFMIYLEDRGRKPATQSVRYRSLQRFFVWAAEELEIINPMDKTSPPKVPEDDVPMVPEEGLVAMLATCKGKTFDQRRDNAILRLFIDCGLRLSEVAGLTVDSIDLVGDCVRVDHTIAKGGRTRMPAFNVSTAQALERYLRVRATHPHGRLPYLFVGKFGKLSPSGVYKIVGRLGEQAGVGHVHPHQLRHSFAHAWLVQGGSEGGLMREAGWKSRKMVDRYTKTVAEQRARDEHHRLGLGDRF